MASYCVYTVMKIRDFNKMRGIPDYLKNSAFSKRNVFDRVTYPVR